MRFLKERCLFLCYIQEPYQWESVAAISRTVLGIRYSILPYYYTLFYKAHRPVDTSNDPAATVTRPLFFEFQKDINTYSIDKQFLIGNGIMISPVLTQGESDERVNIMKGCVPQFFVCFRCYKCQRLLPCW